MRIGCLQFAPKVGDIENNLNRADAVLSKAADVEELDLMVLPELAFSGYNFKSLQEISPFLEPSGSGITSLWARTMALKYDCTVIAGYPEKVDVSPKWPTGPEYYNSAIVVNADGETIANYRKSFLYYTDESWALEGKGFYSGFIPGLGNAAMGICMDINPYKFEAPWDAYEFAFHILEMQTNIVILSMAWMTREESRMFSRMPNEPDMETLTYWVTRLEPLIRAETEGEIIVIFCNRTGNEGDATYAGTSAVIGIENGEVKVYGLLGRGQKELLVVDTSEPPFAKLVYRPEDEEPSTDEVRNSSSVGTDLTVPDHGAPPTSDRGTGPEAETMAMLQGLEAQQKDAKQADMTGNPAMDKPNVALSNIDVHLTPCCDVSRGRSPQQKDELVPPPPPMLPTFPGGLSIDETNSPLSPRPKDMVPTNAAPTSEKVIDHTPPMVERKTVAPIDVSAANSSVPAFRSPETEGPINIPPPSLPSPRDQALRPKIIIPQSPPMQPQQMYPSNPVSARSVFSEKSIQSEKSFHSVKSDESEASVQTIRSNPRPPEDSTPYPHSGLPLSGYPQNKRIYGGYVSIKTHSHFSANFSPTTPFEDMSPVSSTWYSRKADSALRTPISAGGWVPGTPIGRRPEPFPWHALSSGRSRSRSSNKFATAKTPEPSTAVTVLPQGLPEYEEDRKTPMRPSSPKSRNASRSRTRERAGSSLSQRAYSDISKHLGDVSYRAGSDEDNKEVYAKGIYAKEAAQSAALFAGTATTPQEYPNIQESREISPWASSVPIAADPSILERDAPARMVIPTPVALDYYRPIGRSAYHQRSNSFSNRDEYYSFSPVAATEESSIPRTISRGRQPGPAEAIATAGRRSKATSRSATGSRDRTSSVDSTRNDILHHKVRRSSRREDPGPSDRNNSHNHRHHRSGQSSRAEDGMEFERVEAIICPNCPVHGRRSGSSNTNDRSHRSSRCRNHGNSASREAGHQRRRTRESSTAVSTSSRHAETQTVMVESDTVNGPVSAPLTTARRNDDNVSLAQIIQRPTTAPSTFNPATPRAMPYVPYDDNDNGEEGDAVGEFTLLEASVVAYAEEKTPTTVQLPAVA